MSSGTRIVALVFLAIAGLTLGGLTLLGFAYRLVREQPQEVPAQVDDAGPDRTEGPALVEEIVESETQASGVTERQ